jgi:hypothetical protein
LIKKNPSIVSPELVYQHPQSLSNADNQNTPGMECVMGLPIVVGTSTPS